MSPQPTQAHLDKATCWIVKRPLNVSHQIDSLAQLIADSEAQAAKAECERLKQVKESYQERALTANNELARLRAEVERLTKQIKDDNRSYGCELRDPNGTIWEQAAKDHARAELAEASAKLWEADALRYANNTEFWKARAEKAETEVARLRALFPIICEALGNGSCCTPDVGVDFLEYIPGEVKSVVARLRAELAEWSRLKAWGGTPEMVHKFIKGQQNRIHYCQDLETELAAASQAYDCTMAIHGTVLDDLAAEREKVRVLRDALERRHTEQGYHRQYVDDALDATEDASK